MRKDMTEYEIGEYALSMAIGKIRDYMMCHQDKECPKGLPLKILKRVIRDMDAANDQV